MRGLHLRQVHGSEEAGVLSALTTGSPTAVIGPRRMRALLEAAPAAATTVLTAMEGQQLRGYVHLSTEQGAAWLVSGAVDPAHRRRGIGTALLREAARCARAAGARSLRISGRPAGYAAPGVDPERDPGTAGFLARRGARPAGTALAMTRPLHDLPAGRDRPGLHVATCREQDGPELLAVVEEHLDPGWAALLRRHAGRSEPRERSQPSADLERILLARDRDGALLGFAGWGLVGPDPIAAAGPSPDPDRMALDGPGPDDIAPAGPDPTPRRLARRAAPASASRAGHGVNPVLVVLHSF